jgi:hypothetical protein
MLEDFFAGLALMGMLANRPARLIHVEDCYLLAKELMRSRGEK